MPLPQLRHQREPLGAHFVRIHPRLAQVGVHLGRRHRQDLSSRSACARSSSIAAHASASVRLRAAITPPSPSMIWCPVRRPRSRLALAARARSPRPRGTSSSARCGRLPARAPTPRPVRPVCRCRAPRDDQRGRRRVVRHARPETRHPLRALPLAVEQLLRRERAPVRAQLPLLDDGLARVAGAPLVVHHEAVHEATEHVHDVGLRLAVPPHTRRIVELHDRVLRDLLCPLFHLRAAPPRRCARRERDLRDHRGPVTASSFARIPPAIVSSSFSTALS